MLCYIVRSGVIHCWSSMCYIYMFSYKKWLKMDGASATEEDNIRPASRHVAGSKNYGLKSIFVF